MGFLIGIVRKRFLVKQRSTASWKLQLIAVAMATAHNAANNLLQVGTDYESDSLIAKKLQQRQYKMKILEDKLTQQKQQLETQIQEYNEEIKSCEEMINNGIKEFFSYKAA